MKPFLKGSVYLKIAETKSDVSDPHFQPSKQLHDRWFYLLNHTARNLISRNVLRHEIKKLTTSMGSELTHKHRDQSVCALLS